MNQLAARYPHEIEQILGKYPEQEKRAAVMPLIFLAQREGGYVRDKEMRDIAEILGISTTDVASLVGFYTLFHDQEEGRYRIQVCNDLPCALRGADEFLEKLCGALGVSTGGTTEDRKVTVEAVMCLAACDKAPMYQLQTPDGLSYHENQTVETALEHIRSLPED